MAQPLPALLAELAVSEVTPTIRSTVDRWPWVHRTGRGATAQGILESRAVSVPSAANEAEAALGIEAAVYSFLGSAAYPEGWLAIVHQRLSNDYPTVFTPFDSGSLYAPCIRRPIDPSWDRIETRIAFLRGHEGAGADVVEFVAHFLTAHFDDPLDYVRRGAGVPDRAAYHGLVDPRGDRRAWTVEARSAQPIPLAGCTLVVPESRLRDLSAEDKLRAVPAVDLGMDPIAATVTQMVVATVTQLVLDGVP